MCTGGSQGQKRARSGSLADIYENGESAASLILQRGADGNGKGFGMGHGGILKTEVIAVDYDDDNRSVKSSDMGSNEADTVQDIELQQVVPVYIRKNML